MDIHDFPPIMAATTYFFVGLFIYYKKRNIPVNKAFATMLLCVSLWNVEKAGLGMAPNVNFALWWGDIFRVGLLFIPPTLLHFIIRFTNSEELFQRSRKILLFFYILSCAFALVNFSDYFHGDLIATPWGYTFQGGPLYLVFVLQFIIAMLFSFYYMVRGYRYSDNYHRHRLKYFFLAIAVSFTLGSLNFLPKFGFIVYPFGSIAITIGLFIATYSVVQHRLMDVSVFMSKGLAYILSLTILAIPAFFLIISLEELFFKRVEIPLAIILIMIGMVSIILFNYINLRIDRAMRQIIVRDKYKYHEILEEFSRRLVTIVDLNRLLQMLADTIEKSMGVMQVSIFLHEPEKDLFQARLIRGTSDKESIKISGPSIRFLTGKQEALLRVELQDGNGTNGSVETEILKVMEQVQAEVCLPMVYLNRLIGFINLGAKPGKELYYKEDLNLLSPLANQVAVAIENATLYENLKKSQNIMRRADRLASLGTLIASLAHEIRNPLVSIKTFTQLLPERIDDEEFRSYFLRVASGEIDRLTGLINELLGFARPSEPRPQGEDINAIIDKMEVLVSTEARKKNITLSKNYAPNLPQVNADAEQIKQVLLNILLNAIQAIKGEGQVWVETRLVHVPVEDKVEPYVQVEIRDTGVGIPKENLERIFDPFFSTRPEGSGLGLAISHQIIHEHGGFINVDSEVGKGTSFKVHLALKQGGKVAAQN